MHKLLLFLNRLKISIKTLGNLMIKIVFDFLKMSSTTDRTFYCYASKAFYCNKTGCM